MVLSYAVYDIVYCRGSGIVRGSSMSSSARAF